MNILWCKIIIFLIRPHMQNPDFLMGRVKSLRKKFMSVGTVIPGRDLQTNASPCGSAIRKRRARQSLLFDPWKAKCLLTAWRLLKNLSTKLPCDPAPPPLVWTQENRKQGLRQTCAHPCSRPRYSQQSKGGSDLGPVPELKIALQFLKAKCIQFRRLPFRSRLCPFHSFDRFGEICFSVYLEFFSFVISDNEIFALCYWSLSSFWIFLGLQHLKEGNHGSRDQWSASLISLPGVGGYTPINQSNRAYCQLEFWP